METTENPRRTYQVRTTDWHVQVVHPVHGGHDRGRPLDAVHIEWTRQVPDGHPDRPAAIAAAEQIARILNDLLPLPDQSPDWRGPACPEGLDRGCDDPHCRVTHTGYRHSLQEVA